MSSSPDRSTNRSHPTRVDLLILLILFAVTVLLQYAHNAYGAEIGARADESEHFVTGVFLRQFLISGDWFHPYEFAKQYYIHYPKVSLGNWPPFFYVVQAAWMLLFSVSRTSIMALMALICSLIAFIVYRLARPVAGVAVAAGLGLMYVFTRVVHQTTSHVMADGFTALISLVAALMFWLYLESPSFWHGLAWGIITTMAMMSKGNAIALALVFPAAILLTRRWRLLKRLDFWLAVLIVAVVCVPWYTTTLDVAARGWEISPQQVSPTGSLSARILLKYAHVFVKTIKTALGVLTIGMLPFVVIGYVVNVVRPAFRRTLSNLWAVLGAFLLGWLAFHIIVPTGTNPRMLMALQAISLIFAGVGIHWLCQRSVWGPTPFWLRQAALLSVCGVLLLQSQGNFLRKPTIGFTAVARDIVDNPELDGAGILISSTGNGERRLIGELALLQPTPKHVVVRASKLLTSNTWTPRYDRPRYQTIEQLIAVLDRIPISMLVIDDTENSYAYPPHVLLRELVILRSKDWELMATYGAAEEAGSGPISVYRRRNGAVRPAESMSIEIPGFGMVEGPIENLN